MQIHKLQMQCIFGCDVRGRESRGGERLARNSSNGWVAPLCRLDDAAAATLPW